MTKIGNWLSNLQDVAKLVAIAPICMWIIVSLLVTLIFEMWMDTLKECSVLKVIYKYYAPNAILKRGINEAN